MPVLDNGYDVVTPTDEDTTLARESGREIARYFRDRRQVRVRMIEGEQEGSIITLPAAAVRMLLNVLGQMAEGNAVTLIPFHAELTTQQAADLLNVSRPFLIKQLEENKLPYHKSGTHRRIFFRDVLEYKRQVDDARLATLAELTEEAQELNLGY